MPIVKYGDKVHLLNGYANWDGGYLDTNGHSTEGGRYDVSTNASPTRGPLTGTWVLEPTAGQTTGSEVMSGDVIHLRNLYGSGSYLDSINAAQAPTEKYGVQTSDSPDRAGKGTGSWQVLAKTSSPVDGKIRYGDVIQFFNQYVGNGGFLDTCNNSTAGGGAKYDVFTCAYGDRAGQRTADWKMSPKAG